MFKGNNLLIIAAGAGVLYLLYRRSRLNSANTINNLGKSVNGISEIFTGAKVGASGYGWRYFTDGTSIDPNGNYYVNGQKVWSAT
jgi:hypothetical protein